jgi:biotin carboxyl carrier protein
MPGLVIAIPVSEGQQVQKGDILVVLESMKMQNELKSPSAGKVSRLRVEAGDSVEQHQTLLSVEKQLG